MRNLQSAATVFLAGGPDGGGSPARQDGVARPRLRAVEPSAGASARRLRTVVADDDDAIRMLVRTVLGLEPDFEVVSEAETGLEAVQLVAAGGVDLLVLDLSMPEMDGLEVLERLRADGASTLIVVYTGLTRDGIAERARRLGAQDVVTKGVSPLELVERLRAVADGR